MQWMHPGAACPHPVHPLAVIAYPCQQHPPQQQGHCMQAQPPPAQHKEQDNVLKRIKQATDRIAQLETAIKAQTQRQEQQEEVIQDSVAMQQYVSQQMTDWLTWKESEEYQLTYKDNKPAAAQPLPQQSEQIEHRPQQQGPAKAPMQPPPEKPLEVPTQPDAEVKPLIKQILTGLEALLKGRSSGGTKRLRSPSPHDPPPSKHTTYSERAFYSDTQKQTSTSLGSKRIKPILPQKHKAQPSQPPWKSAVSVSHHVRR